MSPPCAPRRETWPSTSTAAGSGQKNGFCSTSSHRQLARSILCGPICTSAPCTRISGTTLRAMAPAATRHRRLARRRAARAPPIAHAIFGEIGVVGVARAELVLDLPIVLGARIDIVDLERDRRAGGHLRARRLVGEHAGEDAHLVGLLALGGVARLTGTDACRDRPGCRPRSAGMPGGQPSTTQPMAGPWLSPQVVMRKRWPKLLCDMDGSVARF